MKKRILMSTVFVVALSTLVKAQFQPPSSNVFEGSYYLPTAQLYFGSISSIGTDTYILDDSTISKIDVNGEYSFCRSYTNNVSKFRPQASLAFAEGELVSFDAKNSKLLKIDSNGDVDWMYRVSGSNICKSHSGNILVINGYYKPLVGQCVSIEEYKLSDGSFLAQSEHVVTGVNFVANGPKFNIFIKTTTGYFAVYNSDNNEHFITFDQNLNITHCSTFGSPSENWEYQDAVQSTTNGNIYLIGHGTFNGNFEHILMRINTNHHVIMSQRFMIAGHDLGGAGQNYSFGSFVETPDIQQHYLNGTFWEDIKDYQDGTAFTYCTNVYDTAIGKRYPAIIQFDSNLNPIYTKKMTKGDYNGGDNVLTKRNNDQIQWIIEYVDGYSKRMDYRMAGNFDGCFLEDLIWDIMDAEINEPQSNSFQSILKDTPEEEFLITSHLEIEWETRLTCEDGQERSQVAQLHSLEMGFINIYPNPSNGLFTLEYLGEENTSYELYNSLGQAIARGNISTGQNQISLSEVSRGTYSIVIKTENSVQNHIIVIK